jgi:hypothetical protein
MIESAIPRDASMQSFIFSLSDIAALPDGRPQKQNDEPRKQTGNRRYFDIVKTVEAMPHIETSPRFLLSRADAPKVPILKIERRSRWPPRSRT